MEQVAGTGGLNIWKAVQLAPTGLTAKADIGAGILGSILTGAAGIYDTYNSSGNRGGCWNGSG